MKEIIYILGWLLMGVLATFLFIAAMCLFLAMPDILEWISGYIGEFMTWVIFLGGIGVLIAWCVDKGRN